MAKRSTGIEKMKTSRSHKTKKRLAIKREMLAARATKPRSMSRTLGNHGARR